MCSLAFIHDANIMHRDVKSANFLISSDCNTKICDFGFARSIPKVTRVRENFNSIAIREKLFAQIKNSRKLKT